nr:SWI/SNF-related matrix-associated actin-dependent regulator of chromatin subfamily A containing DEAD/H box 1-like [Columba livia]
MSLYNLDRFRFERKRKKAEQESEAPAAQGSAAAGGAEDEDEATDDSNRPETPALDVTQRTEYSAVPETPEAKRTRKQSYFKPRRGVKFLDGSSDSDNEEPRNFCAAKENRAPRRNVAVISEQSDDDQDEDERPQLAFVNGGDQPPAVKKGAEENTRDAKIQTLKELFSRRSDQELLQSTEPTRARDEAVAAGLKFSDEAPSRKRKLKGSPTKCKNGNEQVAKKPKSNYLDESEPQRQWERQEMLVKKLQNTFPELDKEELRDVLQEHNWVFHEALEALRVFAEDDEGMEFPPKSEASDWTEASTNSTSDEGKEEPKQNEQNGFQKKDESKKSIWSAKREAEGSEDESASDDGGSSLDEDYSSGNEVMDDGYRAKILSFLQDASLSELALIPQCSQKKAQKIIALRPFNSWEALFTKMTKTTGLSEDIVWNCKILLKERDVVLKLMNKCEEISNKLTKQVTRITEDGGCGWNIEQPSTLNQRYLSLFYT